MSFNAFGPCERSVSREASNSFTNLSFPYDLERKNDTIDEFSPTEVGCPSQTSQETCVDQKDLLKLRRKDLDYDYPLIVAVKDNSKKV
uniref:Uncharacterized protein n=1 Tax=Panagrolaimus sp. PS1159 TaxID=55785 RepID=A0AC35GGP4_9BILA